VRAAPAVSCAKRVERRTRAYRAAESIRHSLRNGFTAYAELSPETNSFCLRRRRIEGLSKTRLGRRTSAGLTPATGARTTRFRRTQPPGFALRLRRARPVLALRFIRSLAPVVRALCSLTDDKPALRPRHAPDAAASTATRPSFVTMANAPLGGTGCGRCRGDLGAASRKISVNRNSSLMAARDGMAKKAHLIWVNHEGNILQEGLNRNITLIWLRK
jgi:hypothetical protein